MAHTKRNFKSNGSSMPTVKDVMASHRMSLKYAYRIVLGLNDNSLFISNQNKFVYRRAMQLIAKHDPLVADRIKQLYGSDLSFSSFSVNELEQLFEQISAYVDNQVKAKVQQATFSDATVHEALEHTNYTDNKGKDLSQEDRKVVHGSTFEQAYTATLLDTAERRERLDLNTFTQKVKKTFLLHLASIRAEALLQSDRIKDAFDFKKNVHVSFDTFYGWFENQKNILAQKKDNFIKSFKNTSPKFRAQANKVCTLAMSGLVLTSSLLSSCGRKASPVNERRDVAKELHIQPDTASTPKNTLVVEVADSVKNDVKEEISDTIRAPQEWNDSIGVTKDGFKAVRDFCNKTFGNRATEAGFEGDNAGFDYAYNRASTLQFDSLDVSPMQTLRAYVYDRSFYPNPDVKGLTPEHANAARAAINLEKFINCDDQIKEDLSHLFIDQVAGNLNIRATYVNNPCDDGNVIYQSTQVKKKQIVQEEQDTAPADTTSAGTQQYGISNSSSFEVVTDTLGATGYVVYKKMKANNLTDGQKVGELSEDDVLGLQARNKKVLAKDAPADSAYVAEEIVVTGKEEGKTFTITSSSNFTPNAAQTDSVATADTTATEKKFNITTSSNFSASDTEKTDSVSTIQNAVSESAAISQKATTAQNDSIVFGTDVPLETPSAGNHEKRGGVDGSGLTAEENKYIDNKLGKETADFMRENIPAWMTNRGGPAEGYSNSQVLYCAAVMAVTAPNTPETKAIFDYTIGCHQGEVMPTGLAGRVKRVIDGIHKNKTRDDMVYTKGIIVNTVDYNGCDKKQTVHQNTAPSGNVKASGPYFDRLFRIPVTAPAAFTISHSASLEITVDTLDAVENVTYKKMKGNNLTDGKKVGELSEEYITSLDVKARKVMFSGEVEQQELINIKKGNNLEDGKIVAQVPTEEITQLTIKKKKACNQRKEAAKRAKREKANVAPVAKVRG